LRLNGEPLEGTKRYKVAGWAPVGEGITGEPIGEVMDAPARREERAAAGREPPRFIGVKDNPGLE
jgi:S-sulfosulfanyl-L-cysteine sulfohydrolase